MASKTKRIECITTDVDKTNTNYQANPMRNIGHVTCMLHVDY